MTERGSATVLVIAGVMACCMAGGLWLTSARAALARQRAETAADMAALAGAQAIASFAPSPCSAASSAAVANGGELVSCSLSGDSVAVAVTVRRPMTARSVARAGPQEAQ